MNMVLKRGSHEYKVLRNADIANDRYVGLIDGKIIIEADTPEGVLASLIRATASQSGGSRISEQVGIDPLGEVGHGGRADRQ